MQTHMHRFHVARVSHVSLFKGPPELHRPLCSINADLTCVIKLPYTLQDVELSSERHGEATW